MQYVYIIIKLYEVKMVKRPLPTTARLLKKLNVGSVEEYLAKQNGTSTRGSLLALTSLNLFLEDTANHAIIAKYIPSIIKLAAKFNQPELLRRVLLTISGNSAIGEYLTTASITDGVREIVDENLCKACGTTLENVRLNVATYIAQEQKKLKPEFRLRVPEL